MIIINTVSTSRFSLNGIEYLKNYISRVLGEKITIYNNYENGDVLLELTNYSEITLNGVVHSDAASLQAELLHVIYSRNTLGNGADINQNNKAKSFHMFLQGTGDVSITGVRNYINDSMGFGGLFNIPETDTPVIIDAFKNNNEGTIKWSFLYGGGKGHWSETNQVSSNQLRNLGFINAAPAEIEAMANTVTIPLSDLPTGNYLPAANSAVRDLSDSESVYFFSYIRLGIFHLLQFTGVAGTYGGIEYPALNSSNLLPSTNDTIIPLPVPSLQQVLAMGYQATNARIGLYEQSGLPGAKYHEMRAEGLFYKQPEGDLLIKYPEGLAQTGVEYTIPAKEENDTFAMLSDVDNWVKAIPKDFFLACTINSSLLQYKSNIYRTFDLQPYMTNGETIDISSQILRVGYNDFSIIANGPYGRITVVTMIGCKLVNNILSVDRVIHGRVTEMVVEPELLSIYRNHGAIYFHNNIYISTRPDNNIVNSLLVKVNPYDITDYKTLSLDVNLPQFQFSTTEIRGYNNHIYGLFQSSSSATAHIVKFDIDLNYHSISFKIPPTNGYRRIMSDSPFIIYHDEVYIVTTNNFSVGINDPSGGIGLSVYDLNGNLKREVINISTGSSTRLIAHWITIFNGKLIFTTSGSSLNQAIIRFDIESLNLEEVRFNPELITHRNSLFSDGYLYLNEETSYDLSESTENPVANMRLLKVKYNDFTDFNIEVQPYGYNGLGSYGSIEPIMPIDNSRDKTSQLRNDGDGTSPFATMSHIESIIGSPLPYAEYQTQPYTATPIWTGTTPPSGTPAATWRATKLGKKLSCQIALYYPSAGTALTRVDLPLPAELPVPAAVAGYTSIGNFPIPVKGYMVLTASSGSPTGVGGGIQKTAGGYNAVVTQSSGAYRGVVATFEYWID